MNPTRLLAASLAVGLWAFSANATDLRPEDAASHIGETATVCGMVASAKFEAHARAQPTPIGSREVIPACDFYRGHIRRSSVQIRHSRNFAPR